MTVRTASLFLLVMVSTAVFGQAGFCQGQESSLPQASPSVVASPVVPVPLSGSPIEYLRKFDRAQKDELAAFLKQQKDNLASLKVDQKNRRKEFNQKEKDARWKFFESSPKGPETRTYMRAFVDRQRELDQALKGELKARDHEDEKSRVAFREAQAKRRDECAEWLKKGLTPPDALWPSNSAPKTH